MSKAGVRPLVIVAQLGASLGLGTSWAWSGDWAGDVLKADAALTDAAPLVVIGRVLQDPEGPGSGQRLLVERTLKGEAPDSLPVRLPAEVDVDDERVRFLLFLEPGPGGYWRAVGEGRGVVREEPPAGGEPDVPRRDFAMFADWIEGRAQGIFIAAGYVGHATADTVSRPAAPEPPPREEEAPTIPKAAPQEPVLPVELETSRADAASAVLPAPGRPLLFGYAFSDGRYGDFRDEVGCYTNLYHAWARRGYEESDSAPDDQWLSLMSISLMDAANAGQRIVLNLSLQDRQPGRTTPIDRVLGVAGLYWNQVVAIELADEPDWSQETAEVWAAHVRELMQERGLANRPIGVVLGTEQALATDLVEASGIDFVTIDGYLEPPGSLNPALNEALLDDYVNRVLFRLPASKQAILVMMAYTRNGAWTNLSTLAELQTATYRIAVKQPRIFALTMFAYGRPTGTRDHPELRARHVEIARAMEIDRCGTAPAFDLLSDRTAGGRPLRVSLTAEIRDAPTCGAFYTWDFGDGTRVGGVERCCTTAPEIVARRTLSIVHQYDRPGTFTPMLRFDEQRSSRPRIVVEPD